MIGKGKHSLDDLVVESGVEDEEHPHEEARQEGVVDHVEQTNFHCNICNKHRPSIAEV
jgi:hypothetical protein